MIKSEQLNELATSLAKAQSEIEGAKKDSKAYSYSYSDLATVIAAVKPALNRNGLSFTQLIEESEAGFVKVTTLLLHQSGQYLGSTGTTEIPEMKSCNLAQRAGAAQSYLKRYQLQALTGLPTEDNDASSDGFSANKSFSEKKAEVSVKADVPKVDAAPKTTGFKRTAPANNSGDL